MSSRLKKIRSVHTYVIPRTVYFRISLRNFLIMRRYVAIHKSVHFLSKMAYFLYFNQSIWTKNVSKKA